MLFPFILNIQKIRDSGYGYGGSCYSGLGIFNFLLFLVVLLGLLSTLLQNAMVNIMINGETVSIFQVKWNYRKNKD